MLHRLLDCGFFGLCGLLFACGSRSELNGGERVSGAGGSPPVMTCDVDTQCPASDACGSYTCVERRCQFQPVSCDDRTACTEDSCDPVLGCRHRFLSLDMDGDGHRSPRPGFAPGSDDGCGDDCDDTNPNIYPGNKELCDGVDNDCDSVVDNGFAYQRSLSEPVRVAPLSSKRSQRDDGGITATNEAFVIAYTSLEDRYLGRILGIGATGQRLFETDVSEVNSNSFGGSIVWSGQDLATAWSDARQGGSYDLYARLLGPRGEKQAAPTRVTDTLDFSLHPNIKWNQSEFLVAFDDRRSGGLSDHAQIYAQRMAPDGSLLGQNVLIAPEPGTSESPVLALSPRRVGLAYTMTRPFDEHSHLGFRVLDASLGPVGNSTSIGTDVDVVAMQFVKDRFVVLWDVSDGTTQGSSIMGATFDESGGMILSPRPVTDSARFARSVAALSLGDRLLMMWGDDAESEPGVYELHFQVLNVDLKPIVPRQRFTFWKTNSLMPSLAPGPGGKIGVAFESWKDGSRQVYFSALECAATQ